MEALQLTDAHAFLKKFAGVCHGEETVIPTGWNRCGVVAGGREKSGPSAPVGPGIR